MPIIKLIDRTTDISRLKMRQMNWDTVINEKSLRKESKVVQTKKQY